jgi:hypothetical protein
VSSEAIHVQKRQSGEFVDATLLTGMVPANLLVVESSWHPLRSMVMQELLAASVPQDEWPQSIGWDWARKSPLLQLLVASGYGIVCEQKWQGVMLTKTEPYRSRLNPDKGKPLVYVDFLEVAPWNWTISQIGRTGQYRLVGSTLLWRAVKQSEEEGFHGRVGLHALPQAEGFYSGDPFRMTPIGRDPNKEHLLYFELSREQAEKMLQQEKHNDTH